MTDPRGFTYAMQALLDRSRWQLDALQCALADALARQREGREELARLQALQRAARGSAAAAGAKFDPLQARTVLNYLCQVADQMHLQAGRCDALEAECSDKRHGCAQAQARLEAIEAHRARALAAHWQLQARRDAALADEQWMGRRTREGSPMAGEST